MRTQIKVVRIGNSWGVRLPKAALELSGLKPGAELDLEVRNGRITLRHPDRAVQNDAVKQAYEDAKTVWDEALEDVWLEIFGIDE
jgi:antitoxin component of MazEF toxin-antitoxin module